MEIKTATNLVQIPDRSLNSAQSESLASERHKQEVAKDFESVLLNKLCDEMQNTIPDSELLEDDTSKQMQGIFWMYMAQDVADKGGMGLWKEIYKQMNKEQSPATLDSKI